MRKLPFNLEVGVFGVSANLIREYLIDAILSHSGVMTRQQILALVLTKVGVNKLIIVSILLFV
jgi:hypothetical protein